MDISDGRYKVILTDLFDTLVLRKVTAKTVVQRWAVCLKKKYRCLERIELNVLVDKRFSAFKSCREKAVRSSDITRKTEVDYETALGTLFESIPECSRLDKSEFINISRQIDVSVECGCVYSDKKYLNLLYKAKRNGKKIFCVSDYYLPESDLRKIIRAADISENLFDGIFVSCDLGKRKAIGDIYHYILNKIQMKPTDVIMIGDCRAADYINAKSSGINAWFRPNYVRKSVTRIREILGIDYAKNQMKVSTDRMYRSGADYSEYIAIFYVFTKRLFWQLSSEGVSEIAFMAREGYYLRKLFETFQNLLVDESQQIKTTYYWCSRRSIMSGVEEEHTSLAIEGNITIRNWLKSLQISIEDIRKFISFNDEELDILQPLDKSRIYKELNSNPKFLIWIKSLIQENKDALLTYTRPFIKDGVFRFVDSGWKCTSQNAIEKYYGIKTKGYYIGVQIPDKPILDLDRMGIIFSEENPRSKYYDYLGTNIPFYQQLLAAPHGTALKYISYGKKVRIVHEWDVMEKELYKTKISDLQAYMHLKFMGLEAWDDTEPYDKEIDWLLAKISMRSSLFAHGTRLEFIRTCTENYVQNFRQENRGKVQYDARKIKVGLDVIWKPEKLIRYVSKIQRTSLYDKKIVKWLYPVISRCFYIYVSLLSAIRK